MNQSEEDVDMLSQFPVVMEAIQHDPFLSPDLLSVSSISSFFISDFQQPQGSASTSIQECQEFLSILQQNSMSPLADPALVGPGV